MKTVKIKRYLQDPGHCAVASCASVANFYNKNADYNLSVEITKNNITQNISQGLYTGSIGLLLNYLGFDKVTVISSDVNYLDYSWSKLSKIRLVEKLDHATKWNRYGDEGATKQAKDIVKFLKNKSQNKLIIDYNFKDYIVKYLNKDIPILLSFNWTIYFRYSKWNENERNDPVRGFDCYHAVCCNGYDDKRVSIVDSHTECYKYRLKRFIKGRYKMTWENLLTCLGQGDLIIPEKYNTKSLIL